jgi:hypothetical protein
MEDKALVKSRFSAAINAHIEKGDIPLWGFRLPSRNTDTAPRLNARGVQPRRLMTRACRSMSKDWAEAWNESIQDRQETLNLHMFSASTAGQTD